MLSFILLLMAVYRSLLNESKIETDYIDCKSLTTDTFECDSDATFLGNILKPTWSIGAIFKVGASHELSTMSLGAGELVIGSGAGVAPVAATLTGTANRVTVTSAAGAVPLSAPQDIHIAATPTFSTLSLTAATNWLTLGSANR